MRTAKQMAGDRKRIKSLEIALAKSGSLCWQCKKAKPGQGCCWVDDKPSGQAPVPGWQTIEREVVQGRGKGIVQIVQACPQFEEE